MRRAIAVLAGVLLVGLGLPAMAGSAQAGTSTNGPLTITVPDLEYLPQVGFKDYFYTVSVAGIGSNTTWILTLGMSKAGGGAKVIIVLPGVGSETVPNLSRTVHTKTDALNGPGVYTWAASLNVGGTISAVSTTSRFIGPSSVAITTAPPPVKVGQQYAFAGNVEYLRAATNTWQPVGVVTLNLYWRPAGSSSYTSAGTISTNIHGKFIVVHYGAVSGTWDVYYPGTTSVAPGSHTVVLTVI